MRIWCHSPRLTARTVLYSRPRNQGLLGHNAHRRREHLKRSATAAARSRCEDKCKETRKEEAPRPVGSLQAVSNCKNVCDSVCSLNTYVCTRSSFLLTQSTQRCSPLPWATRATAHTGYSRAALASDPNDQAAKAAMSVPERVKNYSMNLTLVALHKTEGTPYNSDADHPVSTAWCSL